MNDHESKTVDAFIVKQKRERYRSFLANPKKRVRLLDRLNHSPDLDPRFAEPLAKDADVPAILREHGSPKQVYIISCAGAIDGRTLPLDEAVRETEAHGWGTIISCVPGRLAFYYGEEGEGRALLERRG